MSGQVYLHFCRYCGSVSASGIKRDPPDHEKLCQVCHVTAPHARLSIVAQFTDATPEGDPWDQRKAGE